MNNANQPATCTVFIISMQPVICRILMSTGEMFVMLFIYVAPLNYSFVYLFMGELTEIGKFIFAEGLLASFYSHPKQRKRKEGYTSGLLVITLCSAPLVSQENNFYSCRQVSRPTGRKISEN